MKFKMSVFSQLFQLSRHIKNIFYLGVIGSKPQGRFIVRYCAVNVSFLEVRHAPQLINVRVFGSKPYRLTILRDCLVQIAFHAVCRGAVAVRGREFRVNAYCLRVIGNRLVVVLSAKGGNGAFGESLLGSVIVSEKRVN